MRAGVAEAWLFTMHAHASHPRAVELEVTRAQSRWVRQIRVQIEANALAVLAVPACAAEPAVIGADARDRGGLTPPAAENGTRDVRALPLAIVG